jgi:hypothetical protein
MYFEILIPLRRSSMDASTSASLSFGVSGSKLATEKRTSRPPDFEVARSRAVINPFGSVPSGT